MPSPILLVPAILAGILGPIILFLYGNSRLTRSVSSVAVGNKRDEIITGLRRKLIILCALPVSGLSFSVVTWWSLGDTPFPTTGSLEISAIIAITLASACQSAGSFLLLPGILSVLAKEEIDPVRSSFGKSLIVMSLLELQVIFTLVINMHFTLIEETSTSTALLATRIMAIASMVPLLQGFLISRIEFSRFNRRVMAGYGIQSLGLVAFVFSLLLVREII